MMLLAIDRQHGIAERLDMDGGHVDCGSGVEGDDIIAGLEIAMVHAVTPDGVEIAEA